MRHCCQFRADEIYYLKDNNIYTTRVLSIGFCPICKRPVAELIEYSFAGSENRVVLSGIHAQYLMYQLQGDILYSSGDVHYRKIKSKPYGWKYGVNKETGTGKVKQYACDFYGNNELIKTI